MSMKCQGNKLFPLRQCAKKDFCVFIHINQSAIIIYFSPFLIFMCKKILLTLRESRNSCNCASHYELIVFALKTANFSFSNYINETGSFP